MAKSSNGGGARPTHQLKVKDKTTGESAIVGVGWWNPDTGIIGIKLNAHVVLGEVSLRTCHLSLMPADYVVSTDRVLGGNEDSV